jgi:hypothetical protein
MRTTLRSSVIAAAASSLLLAACRSAAVPNQVLTKPVPVAVVAPVTRTIGPWLYRPSSQRQTFVVDQRAAIAIRLDTSTQTDTVSSHAEVAFSSAPATSAISGSVDAFLVASAGHAAATPPGLAIPIPVRADYSARTQQLDVNVPHDAAPCSSAELAVVQSLRDLWLKPPDTLRIGSTWEDSSSYVMCRADIPLRVTAHRAFRVTGSIERNGRLLLEISRQSRTKIEGAGAQFGEAVTVSGAGSGQLAYDLDPANGGVVSARGNATLDLTFRSRLRTQVVRQAVETRISRS